MQERTVLHRAERESSSLERPASAKCEHELGVEKYKRRESVAKRLHEVRKKGTGQIA